jgi:hypothetical protein
MPNTKFDFDPDEVVETLIKNQVEVRTSKFIATFCVTVMFGLLAMVSGGATLLILNSVNQPPLIIKQPN